MSEPKSANRMFQCDRCRLRFHQYAAFLKHGTCQGPSAQQQGKMEALREKLVRWGDPR